MKLKLFAVMDKKVASYQNPFFALANGQAMRSFGDSVQAKDSPLSMHPEDYELYHIGDFDQISGELMQEGTGNYLCRGLDFVEKS